MPNRSASAQWNGGLKAGNGTIDIPRANLQAPYNAPSRFEEGQQLSPEDLVAGAHAACFSMALSADLEKAGFTPESVQTKATVHLEFVEGAPTITRIDLDTTARVPGLEDGQFQEKAEGAKKNCPISRLYKGAEIKLTAKLA